MRIQLRIISAAIVMLAMSSAGFAQAQRFGVGAMVDGPAGDTDTAPGAYATYMHDLTELLTAFGGVSYSAGDYDLEEQIQRSGSFTSIAVEGGLAARFELEGLTPYAGFGGAYHYLDFDDMNVSDKLSLLYMGGALVPMGPGFDLDASVRFRFLRPKSYYPELDAIDMDAWTVRVGGIWSF
jgi:hypothetical protein